jgi:serine/threonine protein phosphatase PrpC
VSARTPRAWPGCAVIRAERIIGRRLAGGRPVLGICVGMQILFERGVEHGVETEGCDEWPGVVERLQAPVVPHMGWNTVDAPEGRAVRRHRGRALLLRALLRRPRLDAETNDRTKAPLVTWAQTGGRARRRPLRRGRRERPAVGHPVPPREVRRRRRAAAAQLGHDAPPAHGGVDSCDEGYCTYTPAAGYSGPDSFTWKANDGIDDSNVATVSIDVVTPGAPTAQDGFASVNAGVPEQITLYGQSESGGDLAFAIVTAPTHGGLGTIAAPSCSFGSCSADVTYTPAAGATGDEFTFRVTDGALQSAPATITISVVGPVAPTASSNSWEAGKDTTTTLELSASDDNMDPLTFAIASGPGHGTLGALSTPACDSGFCSVSVDYTPTAGYLGSDSFTFTASDGTLTSEPGTISIDVVPAPCTGAVISNGTVQLGVNCRGELNVGNIGLHYVPTDNDSTAPGCPCEGWGAADATTGVSGYANQSSGTADLDIVSFTSDADSATSVTAVGTTLQVTHDYQPSAKTANAYDVGVSVKNVSAAPVELRYRRVMDWDIEPTAFSEFVTLNKGTASEIVFTSDDGFASANALAGPSDLGQTGNFVDAGPADHGALFDFNFGTLAPGATKTFQTYYGAAGTETGAIDALNAIGAEAYSLGEPNTPDGPTLGTPNTFFFAFGSVGGAPIFAPDAVDDTLTTAQATAGVVNVLANDTDANGDTLAVTTPAPTAAHGTVSCTAVGACTYTPAAGYSGADSFTYGVSDGHGGTDTASVAVTVTPGANTAPNAIDDSLTTAEDTAGAVNVLANDTDAEGDARTVTTLAPSASHGTVACTAAGVCTYTPQANYSGPDSFTYGISDGHGGTDTATVAVTVTPVNDAPDAVGDTVTTPEDTATTVSVLANDTDVDGDTLSVSTSAPAAGHGTVACTVAGVCTYTPQANYSGPDFFAYGISDGHGGTDTATVAVTVTAVNDAPTAADDALTTAQDTSGVVTVLTNDADVDGDALTVTTTAPSASHGTVACTASGSCTYSPSAGYSGADAFSYDVSDGHGGTDTASVAVTVSAVVAGADVSIEKLELVNPVAVGNDGGYQLVVHNGGVTAATTVTVTDPLPAGFKVRAFSGATCTLTNGTLSCALGTLAAGATSTIRVDGAFVKAGTITNVASVSSASDPNPGNDSDTSSCCPPSTSPTGRPSSWSRAWPARRSGSATRSRPRCAGRRPAPSGSTWSTSTRRSAAATTASCRPRSSAASTSRSR